MSKTPKTNDLAVRPPSRNAGVYFFAAVFGFGGGVLARSFFDVGTPSILFLLVLACALAFISAFVFRQSGKNGRQKIFVVACALVLIAGALGIVRTDAALDSRDVALLEEGEYALLGEVVDEPSTKESTQRIVLEISEIDGAPLKETTRAVLFTTPFPRYEYGDVLRVEGDVVPPEDFQTDTGRVFTYTAYLEKDRIFYQVFRPDIEPLDTNKGNFLRRILFDLRRFFTDSLKRVLPEPAASLGGGITVGTEDGLGGTLERDFRRTGIIHIVVLSGFNVTIVADTIMRLFSRIPLLGRSLLGGGAIFLFMLLTGAGATVIRASIMAGLVILARAVGRRYDIARALALAGVAMVALNPLILAFDPSFQLSFLATLGLIYISPLLDTKLTWITWKWLKEIVSATISAQIAVLPFLLYQIGELSIVALPVNLLVLPIIPLAMLLVFLAGGIGWVSTALALPFASISYVVLEYVFKIVDFFARVPGASIVIPPFPWWLMVLVYVSYVFLIGKFQKQNKR